MTTPGGPTSKTEPVERFKPTTGLFPGYAGLLIVVVGVGYIAVRVHTLTGLQVALGLLFFGVVIWLTQLRPRATAYSDTLVLKNSLVDAAVPLHLVDEVSATRTLNVWVGDRRYLCLGIGRSMRSVLGEGRASGSGLGMGRLREYGAAQPDRSSTAYETFVVNRIQDLADKARKFSATQSPQRVRRIVAWPESVVLAVTGTAFVVSLFL